MGAWTTAAVKVVEGFSHAVRGVFGKHPLVGKWLERTARDAHPSLLLARLKAAALWLSLGLTFLLASGPQLSGVQQFPTFVVGGDASPDGSEDDLWVDDDD